MTTNNDAPDAVIPAPPESPAPIAYADASVPTARETALRSGVTRGDVAALTVRLYGIYLVLQALPMAGYVLVALIQSPRLWGRLDFTFLFYVAYLAVFAGVGTWLVIKAPKVGAWLLPKATVDPGLPPVAGSPQGMQAVAFSVVGLFLAASAFPELAAALARYANSDRDLFATFIKSGAAFVAGLFLFFRAKRITGYWQQIGHARTRDESGPL